jgi:hypothetical protein
MALLLLATFLLSTELELLRPQFLGRYLCVASPLCIVTGP